MAEESTTVVFAAGVVACPPFPGKTSLIDPDSFDKLVWRPSQDRSVLLGCWPDGRIVCATPHPFKVVD